MSGYRLFIGQLVRDVRRRELEDAFAKYGEIVRIDIKNGFGFVEYEHSRDAEEAVRKMDGKDFLGRRLIVEYARGKKRERDDRKDYKRERNNGPERSDYRVVVEGLGRGTSWQDLKDAFRSSGDILFTDVRRDRYDDYYGIVEFRRRDDIDSAIRKMEGAEINGYKIRVKEDKKKKSRSRSRSEKRRRRSQSGSRDRKRSKSGSRERSPKRKTESRERSPKRKSGSKERSPKKSGSRDRSPRKSESKDRSPKKRSGSRDSKERDSKERDSKDRDSKPRDTEDNKSENKEDNRDSDNKDNEQKDN